MAPLLSLSCPPLLLLPLIAVCFTKFASDNNADKNIDAFVIFYNGKPITLWADGVRSELNIFHHSCALKKDEGPCKAMKDRFYFDIDTGRCEFFEYGGCQGNANNFETQQECEEMCLLKEEKSPCHLEDEPGPCRGLVPRYFFDVKSQECKRFFYGGCFGNANNFKTKKECHDRCLPGSNHMEKNSPLKPEEEKAKPETEPPVKHDLEDIFDEIREVYDSPRDGNAINTFKVQKAGSNHMEQNSPLKPEEGKAKPETEPPVKHDDAPLHAPHLPQRVSKPAAQEPEFNPPEVCMSPVDRGDCDGSERRYVYNPKTQRCQAFRYSGCGGNKNNFAHKKHCIKMCMKDGIRRNQIRIKTRKSDILFRSV